jgi:phage recombination protein Bet
MVTKGKKAMAEEKGVVEYRSRDGQQIKLSPAIIKRFLVSGEADLVTDQEMMLYMGVCKARGMNPFIRDAYLVKYKSSDPAAIITSKDYLNKRARSQPDCRGWKSGIVIQNSLGQIEYRQGCILLDNETLLGGWFEALPDGWTTPMRKEVPLKSYIKKTKDGRVTRFWATEKQPEMIAKVAESQGLRATWPDEFQGLYVDAEMESRGAQAELDQAVKVKSSEPEPAAQQKPIGDILGKPETREAKKHDCVADGHRLEQEDGVFTCRECGGQFDPPYTAPEDEMTASEKDHAERNKLQAQMDAKMKSKRSPEMEVALKFTERFGLFIKSPYFGEFWKHHCEKVNLSQHEAKVSALAAPDNFSANFKDYLKTTQDAQGEAKAEKTTDDTPAEEKPQGGETGPEISPSLKQIFAKFPARLKITEGYKTLVGLAADYPDPLIEILLENPVESLPDLGAALKKMSAKVDEIESVISEGPKTTALGKNFDKKKDTDPLFDEPPMPDGPPEW